MKKLIDTLFILIEKAESLGLNNRDLDIAKNYLIYNEFGLCFDTVITQMYENNIEIDSEFYEQVCKIGKQMNLESENYSFMKELIRM